ncbi:hypothetical protein ACFVGM_09225 [Kitasatospora purpeofusca]|uniref:hypothetical protein n=1 Tax=Kitasatospora purpeofusca TaxID=67352 RepID=UPI00367AE052
MVATVRYHGSEVPVTEPVADIMPLLENARIAFTQSGDRTILYVKADGGSRPPYTLFYNGSVFVWGPNDAGWITSNPYYFVKKFVEHYRSMQQSWRKTRHDDAWGQRLAKVGIEFGWSYEGPGAWGEPRNPGTRFRYWVGFSRPGEHRPGQPQLGLGMSYHWWAPEVFQKIIKESTEREKQTPVLLALLLDQMFLWTRKHRDIERKTAWRREQNQAEQRIDTAEFRLWLDHHHVEWEEHWSPTVNTGGTHEPHAPNDQLWWFNQFLGERQAVREFEMVVGAELLETWLKLDEEKWEDPPVLALVPCGHCGCSNYFALANQEFSCGKCGGSTDPEIDLVLNSGQTWTVDAEGRLCGTDSTVSRTP